MLGAITFGAASAQDVEHPWSIGPDLGVLEYGGDHGTFFYKFNTGYAVGASIFRYLNSSFDVGLNGFYDGVGKNDPNNIWPGMGFNFNADVFSIKVEGKYKFNNGYILKEDARVRPFIKAGLGILYANSTGVGVHGPASYTLFGPSASMGPGVAFKITDLITLQLYSVLNFPFNADYMDLVSNDNPAIPLKNNLGDVILQNAFSLHFTINPKPKDSDKDGVPDRKDDCPDTPKGVAVDENGCPIDSDLDGIADYLDECPSIPGLEEFQGCPDTDGDGVPDKNDECPDIAGPAVLKGCPDTDGDGVADKDDRCPDTPTGWEVDRFGCAVDRDRDGVPDSEDKCPEEPGVAELKGCPWDVPALMVKYELKNKIILFDFDSSDMKGMGIGTLNGIAKALNNHDEFGVQLDGFTDWTGPSLYNMKLSERRVNSAKDYLIGRGISKTRIRTAFHGEDAPKMKNDTKEGRKYNRRVEFNFFNL